MQPAATCADTGRTRGKHWLSHGLFTRSRQPSRQFLAPKDG